MASTYSNLKFELIGTGEQVGTWGNTTNTNLGTAIEQAIVGTASVSFSSADVTLTLTNTNAAQNARALRLNLTGTSGGARNLILGSGCQIDKPYIINNGLADTVTVKNTTGTGVAVPAGKTMWVYNNGTNVVDAVTHLSSLTLGSALPVASGGSGATTLTGVVKGNGTSAFTAGQVNLATEVTGDLPFSNLAQGSALSVLGVTGNATADVASIAAGTDHQVLCRSGTSLAFGAVNLASANAVTGDLPFSNLAQGSALSVLGVTGNAIADVASIAAGTDHQVLRRSGTSVGFGAIALNQSNAITGTLPIANGGTGSTSTTFVNLASNVTGTLPIANGGTGLTATPTNGQVDIGNGTGFTRTTLTAGTGISITNGAGSISIAATNNGTVTSVGGTGTVNGVTLSGTVTSSGNITLGGAINASTISTGTLPVANGGTGQTTYTNGQLLIGNTTGGTLAKATLTASTGISITNGAGSITIAATNNGTVTSVGGTGTINGITLSGTVTSSGNLTLGGAINASTINTGTLPVARGGTGLTTVGTSGNVLTSNGSAWVSQAISAGGDYIMQVYTSSTTWTKPANLKAVKVTVVGAGGNGGASIINPGPGVFLTGGFGGGGGAAIEYLDAPAIPGPVSVTVGTAPSKTSSFGPFLSATGGGNGADGSLPAGPGTPGSGGSGSGGQLNLSGAAGGAGGAAAAGLSTPVSGSAVSGNLYGGGATGRGAGVPPGPGGTGAAGVVIVEEFY